MVAVLAMVVLGVTVSGRPQHPATRTKAPAIATPLPGSVSASHPRACGQRSTSLTPALGVQAIERPGVSVEQVDRILASFSPSAWSCADGIVTGPHRLELTVSSGTAASRCLEVAMDLKGTGQFSSVTASC
jgi:hypothetical protein